MSMVKIFFQLAILLAVKVGEGGGRFWVNPLKNEIRDENFFSHMLYEALKIEKLKARKMISAGVKLTSNNKK